MTNTLCTAFWVPSRVIHITRCSQHPESFVLMLEWKDLMIESVVDLVEEHVDLEGSQFSESILERQSWNSEVHVCLVHHHWLMNVVMISNGFSILLRSTSSSTLNVSLSWEERTRELSFASAVSRVATGRPVLSWVCSTLKSFLSSDERTCWVYICLNRSPVLSEELSSS